MRGIRKTAEKWRGKPRGQSKYQKKIASKTHKGKIVSTLIKLILPILKTIGLYYNSIIVIE